MSNSAKNATSLPDSIPVDEDKVRAIHQPPIPALAPAFKDRATQDIRYLDVDQNLANSYIHAVYEDNKGYIWTGGWPTGAIRYNGHSFTVFTKKEGLVHNDINQIMEDINHNLWFATRGGVSKFDGLYFTNYDLGEVYTMFEDSKGNIWLVSEQLGLLCYNGNAFIKFSKEQGLSKVSFYSITEAKDGDLWLGSSIGLCHFDGTSFTFFSEKDGLPSGVAHDILEDQNGHLWIATEVGLTKYNGVTFSNYDLGQILETEGVGRITTMIRDRENKLWLGIQRGGIVKFDGTFFTYYMEQEGLSSMDIVEIIEDSRGQIWAATHGGGVNKITPHSFTHFTDKEGLSSSFTNSIFEDSQHHLWLSTEGSGMIEYDGDFFYHYTEKEGLMSGHVQYITEDRAGNIWIGYYDGSGISKYDGTFFTHYTTKNGLDGKPIWYILADKKNNLWVASLSEKLYRFDGHSFTQFDEKDGLLPYGITALAEDEKGHIWLTTFGGVQHFDGQSFLNVELNKEQSLLEAACMIQDEQKNLWIGTLAGIISYDGNSVTSYAEKDGLTNLLIWALQEDKKGNIWIGTEQGLFLLNKNTASSPPSIWSFYKEDGLKGEDIRQNAVCLDHNNQIWWGTGKCVTKLDLNTFYPTQNDFVPTVYLNNLKLNGRFIDFATHTDTLGLNYQKTAIGYNYPLDLEVPYDVNHFTFDFAALDWSAPHKIKYQYQLEGLENTWSQETFEHKVDYRSIPFGNYTFKVKAKSESGVWSEAFTYRFSIRPPWWHTGWAYFSYLCLFLGLMYVIYLFLKRRLLLENQLKQEQAEASRIRELDQLKSRLYTNITHEFRTPLTIILGMAEQVEQNPKMHLKEGLKMIKTNGENLLQLVNQLLDLSKMENHSLQLDWQQSDVVSFLRYVSLSFQSFANMQNLSIQFFTDLNKLLMDFDAERLKQVMTNLISNALKFTDSGGNIKVFLAQKGKHLEIKVQDNGIGIAVEELPHIFNRFYQTDSSSTRKGEGTGLGLAHSKEVVKLMKGSFSVESELGKGSIFTVLLPIQNKAKLTHANTSELIHNASYTPVTSMSSNMFTPIKSNGEKDLPQLLIIEDNPDVVTYLKTCLANNYYVDVAYNGRVGIEKALENIPDLIISDVMMPEKDGFEVCDTLKNDEKTSHIPIVLLTAKADVASKITGLKRGADVYLAKPFHQKELLVRLEMLIEQQKRLKAYFSKNISTTLVEKASPIQTNIQKENPISATPLTETVAIKVENTFIQKVKKIVEENYANEHFALPQLCQKIGMSRSQLYRKMKALMDVSPSKFIRSYRLAKAKTLLKQEDIRVSEVSWKVGFKDAAHFSKAFFEEFGEWPSEV